MTETSSEERRQKLFVGGLNRETTSETLKEYFDKYGDISDCVVIQDGNTKHSRGFGYVTFSDYKTTKQVLSDKRNNGAHVIDNKECEVKRAIPRDDTSPTAHNKTKKVFIGGIPDNATDEDIKDVISDALETEAVKVDLIKKKDEPDKHRGFCFVELDNEDDADELCCIKKIEVRGKMVEIKKAEPKGGSDGGHGGGRGGRGGNRMRGGGGGGYRGGSSGGYGGGGYGGGGGGYGVSSYDNYSHGSYPSSFGENYGNYGGGVGGYASGYGSYDGYGGMGMYSQSSYAPPNGGGRGGRGGARFHPY